MKKMIIALILVFSLSSIAFAEEVKRGRYIPSGSIVYYNYYGAIQTNAAPPAQAIITTDYPVVEVISTDRSLGMVQVAAKLSEESLPILIWVRIIDIKYR